MDLFKFNNPTAPSLMEQGQIINNIKSKMWIERYDDAGEFTLVAPASTGLREFLPTGTFISHVNTQEIMVVENHEIKGDRDKDPELTITGRGYEAYVLENRIVGWSGSFPEQVGGGGDIYFAATGEIWDHIVDLIEDHSVVGHVTDADNGIPYLEVYTALSGVVDPRSRNIERGLLFGRVQELLKADNLGIKVVRPDASNANVVFEIHRGEDRSDEVMFSFDTGEIESADYLWSIKKLKNAALLTGKWIQTVYEGPEVGIERRMMEINAESVDSGYATVPVGGDLTTVLAGMQQLAIDTLAAQTEIALTNAQVSKDTNKLGYRTDFNVGDLITVTGDYNATSTMRISEYVEIEDENGQNGYPTLSAIA